MEHLVYENRLPLPQLLMVFRRQSAKQKMKLLAPVLCILAFRSLLAQSPGSVDLSFGSDSTVDNYLDALRVQPDGKVLISGEFSHVNGVARRYLARLDENGQPDLTFDAGLAAPARQFVLQPNGKILICGAFNSIDGVQRVKIGRLNADGSVDLSFKTPVPNNAVFLINTMALRGDGKIYVAGAFNNYGGHPTTNIALLNPDGSLDTAFRCNGTAAYFQGVTALALYPDVLNPQFVVAGSSSFLFGANTAENVRDKVARLDATTGEIDRTFNLTNAPVVFGNYDVVNQLEALPGGKILMGGVQTPVTNQFNGMLRLNANGTLDPTFHAGPVESTFAAGAQLAPPAFPAFARRPDGRIVAVGLFEKIQGGKTHTNVIQLLADGSVDPSFTGDPGLNGQLNLVALQPDGRVLIAGSFTRVGGVPRQYLARLHGAGSGPIILAQPQPQTVYAGGTLVLQVRFLGDPTPTVQWFRGTTLVGSGGTLTISNIVPSEAGSYHAVLQNSLGSISSETVSVTVPASPPVLTLEPQDQRISVAGTAVYRVDAMGSGPLTYQWKKDGVALPNQTGATLRVSLALAPGQPVDLRTNTYSVVVHNSLGDRESRGAAFIPAYQGFPNWCFYHEVRPSIFSGNKVFPPSINSFPNFQNLKAMARQSTGHLIVGGGDFVTIQSHLTRLHEWGALADSHLNNEPNGDVEDITVAPDDSFYAVGPFTQIGGTPRHSIAKFTSDFAFVPGFAPTLLPADAVVYAVAAQGDGKVVIGGTFTNVNGQGRTGLARLLPDGGLDATFVPALSSVFRGHVLDIALQADGRVLASASGSFIETGGVLVRNQLVRLHADGSWDDSFETYGGANESGGYEYVNRICVQPDQRILITGLFGRFGGAVRRSVCRLLPSGQNDASFDPGFSADSGGYLQAMALDTRGRIYVGGNFATFGGLPIRNLVRLHPDGTVDETFRGGPAAYGGINALLMTPNDDLMEAGYFDDLGEPGFLPACPGHLNQSPMPVAYSDPDGHPGFAGYAFKRGLVRLYNDTALPGAPYIYQQPQGILAMTETTTRSLVVGAHNPFGQDDVRFQWYRDQQALNNETNSFLVFNPLTKALAGNYTVVVSNSLGSIPSNPAAVVVHSGISPSGTLLLQAGAFQWRFDPAPGQRFSPADLASLRVDYTTDFVTWLELTNGLRLENGSIVITDPAFGLQPLRFYRLTSP
jgi:uncharacterized delta-60 repeat protein